MRVSWGIDIKLLLGRLLTRSGDQAWDFAVPIVLLKILPNHLRIAALYYLVIRFLSVLIFPYLASFIDTKERTGVIRVGLALQFIGVFFGGVSVYALAGLGNPNPSFIDTHFLSVFVFMVVSGLVGSLGASLMDVSIANDVAPSVFSGSKLATFNSRFRQVDLITEVGSPVLAGLFLAIPDFWFPLTGFGLVVAWNLLSFFPELMILSSVFKERPDLKSKILHVSSESRKSLTRKIAEGWRDFFRQPIAPVMIAYAAIWLSVLSPHGVLLTGFLNDGWHLPEWTIGLFRGSGAFFGLAATFLFPIALKFMNLRKVAAVFLSFQAVTVLGAYGFFHLGGTIGANGFLVLVLFSRIGVYGFGLGEMQIRQEEIPTALRGEINGFANALTGVATLILFGSGAALSATEDFGYLILMSVVFVWIALAIYLVWLKKNPVQR